MIFCSLLANSFVIILIEQLSSEIGLKSLASIGASFLGIRVMKDEFAQKNGRAKFYAFWKGGVF